MNKIPRILRVWLNEPLLSSILMICMVIGIAMFVLLTIHITYQLSWDEHLPNYRNIWRLQMTREGSLNERSSTVSNDIFEVILGRLPQIRDWYMVLPVLIENNYIYEDRYIVFGNFGFCSKNLPEMLDLEMVYGSRDNCFSEDFSTIISHKKSLELFGDVDPTGETLYSLEDGVKVPATTISGVFEDPPPNQHLQCDAYRYIERYDLDRSSTVWENPTTDCLSTQIYALLEDGTDPQILVDEANRLIEENRGHIEGLEDGDVISFRVTRLDEIHYDDNTDDIFDFERMDRTRMIKYGVVALAILAVLVTNSMILLTVRVMSRKKEIDIRRNVGAGSLDILRQFAMEHTGLYSLMVVLSGILVYLILPWVHSTVPGFTTDNIIWHKTIAVSLIGLLVAGSIIVLYPAIVARMILFGKRSSNFWKIAMLVQLTISMILIVSAILLYRQTHLLDSRDPGFDIQGITSFQGAGARTISPERLEKMLKIPGVEAVTSTFNLSFNPGMYYYQEALTVQGEESTGKYRRCAFALVADNFFDVFRINLLQGRTWEGTDSTGVVVNQAFMNRYSRHGIDMGTPVEICLEDYDSSTYSGSIIGVVEDCYWRSTRNKADPMVYFRGDGIGVFYHFRITPTREREAQKQIMEMLEADLRTGLFSPEMYDTDREHAYQYDEERNFMKLTVFIAALGMFFTFVGIFGMTAYTLRYQMKNLAIRKVFGATPLNMIAYLMRSYLILLGIALGVSIPVCQYVLQKWLQNFANRVGLNAIDFLAGLAVSFVMILLAVLIHWLRLHRTNLIEYLRTE